MRPPRRAPTAPARQWSKSARERFVAARAGERVGEDRSDKGLGDGRRGRPRTSDAPSRSISRERGVAERERDRAEEADRGPAGEHRRLRDSPRGLLVDRPGEGVLGRDVEVPSRHDGDLLDGAGPSLVRVRVEEVRERDAVAGGDRLGDVASAAIEIGRDVLQHVDELQAEPEAQRSRVEPGVAIRVGHLPRGARRDGREEQRREESAATVPATKPQ